MFETILTILPYLTPLFIAIGGTLIAYLQLKQATFTRETFILQQQTANLAKTAAETASRSETVSRQNTQAISAVAQQITRVGVTVDGRVSQLMEVLGREQELKEKVAFSAGQQDAATKEPGATALAVASLQTSIDNLPQKDGTKT